MVSIWTGTTAERLLQELSAEITRPQPSECLQCYVARMLDSFGCDTTLRFALRYRDLTAPAAVALQARLARVGGFCDCEIFLNGWWLERRFWESVSRPRRSSEETGATAPPAPLPPCGGVRRGSTQPCANWARRAWYEW